MFLLYFFYVFLFRATVSWRNQTSSTRWSIVQLEGSKFISGYSCRFWNRCCSNAASCPDRVVVILLGSIGRFLSVFGCMSWRWLTETLCASPPVSPLIWDFLLGCFSRLAWTLERRQAPMFVQKRRFSVFFLLLWLYFKRHHAASMIKLQKRFKKFRREINSVNC